MSYIVNDAKSNDTPTIKIKKKSVEECAISILKWGLHIESPENLNVSGLMYHALRWHPGINNLNRIDTNAVMMQVFKTKKYVSKGIYSIINILTMIEQRHMDIIKREKLAGSYSNQEIDDMIRNLILVMRKDLSDAQRTITTLTRNPQISPSALWYIINETAILAMKNGVTWVTYLTQNSLIDDLIYRGTVPIEEWLSNSGIGFSESEFKKEQERKKDRDLNNKINRQAMNSLQTLTKSLRSNQSPQSTKGNGKRKNKLSFKQALKEVEVICSTVSPNLLWDKAFCVFYNHPNTKCKFGDKCARNHSCPLCNGNHPISDCPQIAGS